MMTKNIGHIGLRWVARVWSIASIAFVLLFILGEGLTGPAGGPTTREWIGLALWPIGVSVGLIVAWFREGLGGVIAMGSLLIFYLWNLVSYGSFPQGPFFFVLAAPGVIFFLLWLFTRSKRRRWTS